MAVRPWAAAVLAISLVGCWTSETPAPSPAAPTSLPPSPAAEGGTLRYAIAEPRTIVPGDATEASDLVVVDALFDSLTAYADNLSVVPAAAESWSSDPEARTWTFVLRSDATFHDGTPVNARHFKRAWERAVADGSAGYHLAAVTGYDDVRSGAATTLRGVDVTGPTDAPMTLRVRLTTPAADFPSVVAHPSLAPLPDVFFESAEAFAERAVGNGPFRMSEPWAHNRFIRASRFPEWRNGAGPATVNEVVFQITDPDTAYLAFQQERLDFTTLPEGALSDALGRYGRSDDGYTGPGVLGGDIPVVYYLGVNHQHPPFDDPAVRHALSLALDRAAIVTRHQDANVVAATGLVPPAVPGSRREPCASCRHDPGTAAVVFAERGITQMELWFNSNGGHESVAQEIRSSLAAAGVGVVFRTVPLEEYLQVLRDGGAGLFRFGWSPDYPTLDGALAPILHSTATPDAGGFNHGRYANPRVDELLDLARATLGDERSELYREVERIAIDEDMAVIPVMTYRHRAVSSARVQGFRLSPLGLPNLASVRLLPLRS